MKVYEFGDKNAPAIFLLPGTCCYWNGNFGAVIPLLYPMIHDGDFKSGFMKKRSEKSMAANGEYGRKLMDMMKGPKGEGMPFVSRKSVANQFGSDMMTPLPDKIGPAQGEIHIFYALKMGEKYRDRYLKYFAHPFIHEHDLRNKELLACYPEKWTEEVFNMLLR